MATGWPAGERNSWHGPDKSAIRKKTLGGNDDGKTDGRAGQSGGVRPQFAQLNDDVLFGQVWNREGLSLKLRSILTVTALVSKGLVDSSFQYHLTTAKQNGVTKSEMAEILTHLAFYAGWPQRLGGVPYGSGGLSGR